MKLKFPLNSQNAKAIISLLAALVFSLLSLAGCNNTVDPKGAYEWPDIFSPRNISTENARLMTVFDDELIVFKINGLNRLADLKRIGRWDGHAWKSMGNIDKNLDVKIFCSYEKNLYAGGVFHSKKSEGSPLVMWDGLQWLKVGESLEGSVHALVQWRGLLIVGGNFKTPGFPQTRNLIAWDGTSWQELPTSGLGGGYNVVRALTVHNDDLIVGGLFAEVGGVPSPNVARFDGTNWHTVGGGCDGLVTHLASYDGVVFVAGYFSVAGENPYSVLAGWDGSTWMDTESVFTNRRFFKDYGPVHSMKVRNGQLYVTGQLGNRSDQETQNLIFWDGEDWSHEPTPKEGNGWSVNIHDVEFFRGNLVAIAPDNKAPYAGNWSTYKNAIVTKVDNQWQWIDWDERKILSPYPKMRLYENELIISGRKGPYGPIVIEAWRDGRWQVLVDKHDMNMVGRSSVLGLSVAGKDLYFLVRSEQENNQFAVYHFAGNTTRQLGSSFPVDNARFIKIFVQEDNVVLAKQHMEKRPYRLVTEVMVWEDFAWTSLDSVPPLNQISDIALTRDGLFIATEDHYPSDLNSHIWCWEDGKWGKVWEHNSGNVSFFYSGEDYLWAGISNSSLADDPAPPLIRWDGSQWQVFGGILAGSIGSKTTSQIQAMVVYQGVPVISTRVQDLAVSNPTGTGDGIYFWQDARWHKFSANESRVSGLLPQGDRLWISQAKSKGKPDHPLTWYDGELTSDTEISPNQAEHFRAREKENKQTNKSTRVLVHWESLPMEIPFPGSGHSITRKTPRYSEARGWGWHGYTKKNLMSSVDSLDFSNKPPQTNLFERYAKIALSFPGKKDTRYQVTFDYRVQSDRKRSGSFQAVFASRAPFPLEDRVSLKFETMDAPSFESGFQTASMMCQSFTDTTLVFFQIDASKLPPGAILEIDNLEVVLATQTLLDCYDEMTDILRKDYRRLDGTRCSHTGPWPYGEMAGDATTNEEIHRSIRGMMSSLERHGALDSWPWEEAGALENRKESFRENRDRIDKMLVNLGGKNTKLGWLPDNTFYIWVPEWRDLNKLLNTEYSEFSLRSLGPGTRLILDLRKTPVRAKFNRAHHPNSRVREWLDVLKISEALVDHPTEVFRYLGNDIVVNDQRLASFVEIEPGNEELKHLTVKPKQSWLPRGEIVVLVNEWSHALSVLALKERSGVVVIGEPAKLYLQPTTRFILPNGRAYSLPTGTAYGPSGEYIQTSGISPDVHVKWTSGRDFVFEAAIKKLGIAFD